MPVRLLSTKNTYFKILYFLKQRQDYYRLAILGIIVKELFITIGAKKRVFSKLRIFVYSYILENVQILTKYVNKFRVRTQSTTSITVLPYAHHSVPQRRSCSLYQGQFECIVDSIEKCITRNLLSIGDIFDRKVTSSSNLLHICCKLHKKKHFCAQNVHSRAQFLCHTLLHVK